MDANTQAFLQELKESKKIIDEALYKYMPSKDLYPHILYEGMNYAIFNGGKRLRPIMVLEGAKIAGLNPEKVLPTACALEMMHSYSLVHDDLPAMDNDDLRRGKPTCHIQFGEANAILIGDALLTLAFELIAENAQVEGVESSAVIRVVKEVARAAGHQGMIAGQVLDLSPADLPLNIQDLEKLQSLKTGALFKAALRAGGILGGADNNILELLSQYTQYFGLAFQITDDILDVTGEELLMGKKVGSDKKNDKTTYTSLLGIEAARECARHCVENSIRCLNTLGEQADFLRNLSRYLLNRKS